MPLKADVSQSMESLLIAVMEGATEGARSQSRTSAYAIAPFAALLVKLSQQADERAKQVVKLTWALLVLTLGLFVLTAALLLRGG